MTKVEMLDALDKGLDEQYQNLCSLAHLGAGTATTDDLIGVLEKLMYLSEIIRQYSEYERRKELE